MICWFFTALLKKITKLLPWLFTANNLNDCLVAVLYLFKKVKKFFQKYLIKSIKTKKDNVS